MGADQIQLSGLDPQRLKPG